MVTVPPTCYSTVIIVPAPRKKLDSEFSEEENKLEMADTQAEIILSQGLPRHIFNNLNQTSTAKEIWDNVEMLMQGSGRTIQQRKEDLFDEYERFRAIGNESIHDYFVRFHKLVNDMKITQLNIPTHQMNTKFVNNLPAYWGKYVTNVKQNMDISTTPYVQIYTHLKAYEPHAKKTLKKQEQSTSIVDPLAYVAHTTSAPTAQSSTSSPQPTAQSSNDALMATMTQIANLLSGFQKQFPPTNNQLRTSSNSRTHATVHDGHIVTEPVQRKAPGNNGNTGARGKKVICYNCRGEGHVARQCKEPKRKMDSQYFKDKALLMEAKEKGDVLDAEAEAFLADVECTAPYDQPQALTTTNMFQANHEDAYDSDVDEGPNAAVAFMANLSSTSATNNPVNEVVQIVLWYLDSGCSRHMTGDRARLINFVEKFIGTVRFGNDEYAAIIGYGDYKLGDTIISRVYYVEGLKHNLFSVGQFCDGGLEVAFRQHSCHIRIYDMVDLLKGSRTTNLYSISLNDMMLASPVCLLDS
ncbi:retrovirus-related pol polyprotein from transposon TNT 1-94 [Tanacetum coccineum]